MVATDAHCDDGLRNPIEASACKPSEHTPSVNRRLTRFCSLSIVRGHLLLPPQRRRVFTPFLQLIVLES